MMNDEGSVETVVTSDAGGDGLPPPSTSIVRACLELLRVPNLFTAMADVAMGMLLVQPVTRPEDTWLLGLLMAASAMLYASGVVLNDVFDLPLDARQRPERPIPSGRISLPTARRLGWGLLMAGVICAGVVAFLAGHPRPALLGVLLAAGIVLYDACLSATPLGPVAMGGCRMLNVLLGMSVAWAPWPAEYWLVAAGIGTYIAGVTWFARGEADQSSRWHLGLATLVIVLGIAVLTWFPAVAGSFGSLDRWYLIMAVLAVLISRRCVYAVLDPSPGRVQLAVGQCILSLVILDAVVCYIVRGTFWACLIILLLIPAVVLGQWIKST